jgi:hypothetical protein
LARGEESRDELIVERGAWITVMEEPDSKAFDEIRQQEACEQQQEVVSGDR